VIAAVAGRSSAVVSAVTVAVPDHSLAVAVVADRSSAVVAATPDHNLAVTAVVQLTGLSRIPDMMPHHPE
jgi:hypothetical protein